MLLFFPPVKSRAYKLGIWFISQKITHVYRQLKVLVLLLLLKSSQHISIIPMEMAVLLDLFLLIEVKS